MTSHRRSTAADRTRSASSAPSSSSASAAPSTSVALAERAYTSREAAEVSGVPFFTIDYWGRTKFLVPTVAKGAGRGKGRQRMYSYGDVVRLRIARELRDQKVSLETLRAIIQKLAPVSADLPASRFVMIGRDVALAPTLADLLGLLRRSGQRTFGILLDLRTVTRTVHQRARALRRAAPRPAARRPERQRRTAPSGTPRRAAAAGTTRRA